MSPPQGPVPLSSPCSSSSTTQQINGSECQQVIALTAQNFTSSKVPQKHALQLEAHPSQYLPSLDILRRIQAMTSRVAPQINSIRMNHNSDQICAEPQSDLGASDDLMIGSYPMSSQSSHIQSPRYAYDEPAGSPARSSQMTPQRNQIHSQPQLPSLSAAAPASQFVWQVQQGPPPVKCLGQVPEAYGVGQSSKGTMSQNTNLISKGGAFSVIPLPQYLNPSWCPMSSTVDAFSGQSSQSVTRDLSSGSVLSAASRGDLFTGQNEPLAEYFQMY